MLLQRIERHLRARRMSPTRFGRDAVGDPNLIAQLKHGRELRKATRQRVLDYLDANEDDLTPASGSSAAFRQLA